MSITVYGASDDLVEVEGDISEEFNSHEDETGFLGFSDGTLLSIAYTAEGFWRIHVVKGGTAHVDKVEGDDEDTNYSDRVTLTGDVRWVLFGCQRAVAK